MGCFPTTLCMGRFLLVAFLALPLCGAGAGGEVSKQRVDLDECANDVVAVHQDHAAPLPNGIPMFTVQITNVCPTGCAVEGIHLKCEWFATARQIDPRVFRRLGFNDCLVNDGAPIGPGEAVTFEYANSFSYPLTVSAVTCK